MIWETPFLEREVGFLHFGDLRFRLQPSGSDSVPPLFTELPDLAFLWVDVARGAKPYKGLKGKITISTEPEMKKLKQMINADELDLGRTVEHLKGETDKKH